MHNRNSGFAVQQAHVRLARTTLKLVLPSGKIAVGNRQINDSNPMASTDDIVFVDAKKSRQRSQNENAEFRGSTGHRPDVRR